MNSPRALSLLSSIILFLLGLLALLLPWLAGAADPPPPLWQQLLCCLPSIALMLLALFGSPRLKTAILVWLPWVSDG